MACVQPIFPRQTGNEKFLGVPLSKSFDELDWGQKAIIATGAAYWIAKGTYDSTEKAYQEFDACKAVEAAAWHNETACAPFQAVDAQLHEACKAAKPATTEEFEKKYGQDNLYQKFGYVSKGFDPLKDSTAAKIHEKEKSETQAGSVPNWAKAVIFILLLLIVVFLIL